MSIVAFPGQSDPAADGSTTAAAVEHYLESLTAATTRAATPRPSPA